MYRSRWNENKIGLEGKKTLRKKEVTKGHTTNDSRAGLRKGWRLGLLYQEDDPLDDNRISARGLKMDSVQQNN